MFRVGKIRQLGF